MIQLLFCMQGFLLIPLRQPSVLPGGKTVGGWLPNGFLEVDAVRIGILLLVFLRGTWQYPQLQTRSPKKITIASP